MTITRANYEPFFLDYLEGNLDESMIDQFLDFLEANPDLKEELHLFENVSLPHDQVVFEGKQELYKTTADKKLTTDNRLIAYMEGDLDEDEQKNFETYLASHPEIGREYHLFSKTKLVPDYRVTFQAKQKLYKKPRAVIFMNWASRAAAVLILVWGTGYLIQTSRQPNSGNRVPELAVLKPKVESSITIQKPEVSIQNSEKSVVVNVPKSENQAKRAVFQNQKMQKPSEAPSEKIIPENREEDTMAQISPLLAQLEPESVSTRLAVSPGIKPEEKRDSQGLNEIEQYLADRVKKVGNEGMNSAQRILRTGLNVASELSGKRIGYKVKNGKISSVDFDSRLLAFSIPLDKK